MPSTLSNPLRLGLRQERVIPPQCLVIFGASGDLTHRKLIPALFELYLQRRIPSEFGIVGCARRPWTDNEFREKMKLKLSNQISGKEKEWEQFSNYLFYEPVDLQQSDHVVRLSKRLNEIDKKLKYVYSNLDAWQTTLVARHEDRPKSKFFIDNLFDEFISLSGDRFYGEDKSVISGFGKFNSKSVLVIGQEKGENLETRIERNFGMMRPEGYRKTIRLMNLANKFKIPIINLC